MSELIFDKYEIQNRLAIGGMGEVFYAVQRGAVRGFERPVILKNLLPDLAQQEGFIEQFLDEARVAATLNHPNVVSIYEVGLWNGTYFIAMEFIGGRNISQLIKASMKQSLPIPPAVIARIVHDAALGLDHAHTAKDGQGRPLNIVHRDISPQNIMVREDGVTKVVDFGIARAANRSTRTATGAVKGKLAYMAPEQVASRNIDGLADQFALGVVLWEMCTRRRLFHADRDLDLIKKVLEGDIPRIGSMVPGLPDDLDEIAQRMLSRDPKGRYASSAEVARELQQFLVKFSPPSSESPVASYMKLLGLDDLMVQPQKAPSSKNFVISLNEKPRDPAPPPEDRSRSETVVTTPSKPPVPVPPPRRSATPVVVGLLVLAGLGVGGGVFWQSRQVEPLVVPLPPPQAAVTPDASIDVVEVVAAVPVPVPVNPPVAKQPGRLIVVSTPPGANLRLNGRKSGETPQKLEVPADEPQHLQLDKPGFVMQEQDVTVSEGEEKKLELKLTKARARDPVAATPPATAPPSAEVGYLSVDTTPWSRVSVDGEEFGSTPIFKRKLSAGRHTVMMTAGEVKATRTVEIRPGDVTKLQVVVK